MPELPEVETVRSGMEMALIGAKIKNVTLRRANLRTHFSKDFAKILTGRTIKKIVRRAKYLLFSFDSEDVLIAHLGMSGRFSVIPKLPKKLGAHDHVVFEFVGGRGLIFNDPRRFGLMELTTKKALPIHPLLASLGPEPLEKNFSDAYLKSVLAGRKGAVKAALMDQALVVGVGNIYASEALFLAKIRPATPAFKTATKAALLVSSIRTVLQDAIKSGGSSLRDFVDISGETGYFQHHFNVYGREGEACFSCGTQVENIRISGRSSYFCPKCQR